MPRVELREPWRAFLVALDGLLSGPTELHCLGGFVVSELYGLSRSTADIDVLVVRGQGGPAHLAALGGKGSDLHRKYGLHIDVVTVAEVPEHYEARLVDFDVAGLRHLRIRALERHDLALAKLSRNLDRDVEDIKRLALGPGLDVEVLRARYTSELAWQSGRREREALTLKLWIEIIDELRQS